MNRIVIQTAISNKDLSLELRYASGLKKWRKRLDEIVKIKFAPRAADQLAGEFACLPRVI